MIGVLLVGGGFPHILAFDAVGDDMDYMMPLFPDRCDQEPSYGWCSLGQILMCHR